MDGMRLVDADGLVRIVRGMDGAWSRERVVRLLEDAQTAPQRYEPVWTRRRCCCACLHYRYDEEADDWWCGNPDSEMYSDYVGCDSSCADWQRHGQGKGE